MKHNLGPKNEKTATHYLFPTTHHTTLLYTTPHTTPHDHTSPHHSTALHYLHYCTVLAWYGFKIRTNHLALQLLFADQDNGKEFKSRKLWESSLGQSGSAQSLEMLPLNSTPGDEEEEEEEEEEDYELGRAAVRLR